MTDAIPEKFRRGFPHKDAYADPSGQLKWGDAIFRLAGR